MSRITMTVTNNSGLDLNCTDVTPNTFSNLSIGTTIAKNGKNTFNSESADRVYCTFTEKDGGSGAWQMGMTAPQSSQNNAQGTFNAGLQGYNKHHDLIISYILGTPNQASWAEPTGPDDPSSNVPYGSR